MLAPRDTAAHKHIRCPGIAGSLIRRAVDARAAAVLKRRPNHHRVPAHRHGVAEPVIGRDLTGLQVGLLAPRASIAHKHIHRPRTTGSLIRRAVDTRGAAVLKKSPDHHRVPIHRHRLAERVTGSRIAEAVR